jgi:hypothetical protein
MLCARRSHLPLVAVLRFVRPALCAVSSPRVRLFSTTTPSQPLFFWGHDPSKHGDKACFSNWFAHSPFTDADGRKFGASCGGVRGRRLADRDWLAQRPPSST